VYSSWICLQNSFLGPSSNGQLERCRLSYKYRWSGWLLAPSVICSAEAVLPISLGSIGPSRYHAVSRSASHDRLPPLSPLWPRASDGHISRPEPSLHASSSATPSRFE